MLPGGCTLELAEALMPESDALPVLMRLVEKSLFVPQPAADATMR